MTVRPYQPSPADMGGVKICKACGEVPGPKALALYDFCGVCGKDLCQDCMMKGCCDITPAESGLENMEEEMMT